MKDDGAMFVVKSCDVEYHKPARLDDALEVHSRVVETGNASLLSRPPSLPLTTTSTTRLSYQTCILY
jgi:hypothetical protein